MIECDVDLTEGSLDMVGISEWTSRWVASERAERPEETHAELDQEDSNAQSQRGQVVATRATEALDQSLGA